MPTIPYADFIELVFKFDVEPDRPEEDECPRMSDGIWDLAEQCWNKDPKARPTARQIHDTIQLLMMSILTITPVELKMVVMIYFLITLCLLLSILIFHLF